MGTPTIVSSGDGAWLDQALRILRAGGLVAFPTDTVYGVGAAAFDGKAVARIYQAKDRPERKSIAVLIGQPSDLARVASVTRPEIQRLVSRFWPGPLTLVVLKGADLPAEISGDSTVGVRIPNHPVALELLLRAGPLAVSSANRSGQPDSVEAGQVAASMGGRVDLVVDAGRCPGGLPSTVVDCTLDPPRILREGPVTEAKVLAAWRGD
jgi:L-threonylcarbamoyladenylate synthase